MEWYATHASFAADIPSVYPFVGTGSLSLCPTTCKDGLAGFHLHHVGESEGDRERAHGRPIVRAARQPRGRPGKPRPVHDRAIWGDSRAGSLNHVRNTIDGALDIMRILCGDCRTPNNWESMWTLERLGAEMERCVTGIRNLRSTYSEDLCMVANLDVQADRLVAHRGELLRFLHGPVAPYPDPYTAVPRCAIAVSNTLQYNCGILQ